MWRSEAGYFLVAFVQSTRLPCLFCFQMKFKNFLKLTLCHQHGVFFDPLLVSHATLFSRLWYSGSSCILMWDKLAVSDDPVFVALVAIDPRP